MLGKEAEFWYQGTRETSPERICMKIVIVDDSEVFRHCFSLMLKNAGYEDLILAASVDEAFRKMGVGKSDTDEADVDLILMDIYMPGRDGLQGCRELKEHAQFQDVPIIVISGAEHLDGLQQAFDAGAIDFITKPPSLVELQARVRSALRLKSEMDRRKARERELLELTNRLAEMNLQLEELSTLDGLTGIANRHSFNAFLDREWKRAYRDRIPVAAIMIDIDCFKAYNDTYGHLEGDECLRQVAGALREVIKRPADLLARYGGEEFVAILPETEEGGALMVAEAMRHRVEKLAIPHSGSPVAPHVTVSIGVADVTPSPGTSPEVLIAAADRALYQAKQGGRNRVGRTEATQQQN